MSIYESLAVKFSKDSLYYKLKLLFLHNGRNKRSQF